MTGLPVVERELRMAARNPRTHTHRSQIALVGLAVTAALLTPILFGQSTPAQGGRSLFLCLSGLALAGCLLSGLFTTADALSSERRQGTLGLLLLTSLHNYELLLGKLTAQCISTVFGLGALLPFLALTMLIGGVSGSEFGRMCLVLITALFLSLTTGLFVSSFSRESRNAFATTLLLLLFYGLGSFLDYFTQNSTTAVLAARPWHWPSPVLSYLLALDDGYSAAPRVFWISLGSQWGLSLFWMLAGSFFMHWMPVDPPIRSPKSSRATTRDLGSALPRLRPRSSVESSWMDLNPMYWLARRERTAWFNIWFGFGWVFLLLFGFVLYLTRAFFYADIMVMMIFLSQVLAKLWMTLEITRHFLRLRQSGELELLLVTPMSVKQIVNGQLLCLRRPLLHGIGLVTGFSALMFAVALISTGSGFQIGLLLPWVVATVLFLVESLALVWIGLWQGMKAPTLTRAFLRTMFLILVLPWIYLGLLAPVFLLLIEGRIDEAIWLSAWFGAGYVNAFLWLAVAISQSYEHFRDRASGGEAVGGGR